MKVFHIFIVCFAIVSLTSFTNSTTPPDLNAFLESERIKTVENESLEKFFEDNFIALFDKVTYISVQKSKEYGHYYYLVKGIKNNKKTHQLILAKESDILAETFSSNIDFTKIEDKSQLQYCYNLGNCPTCQLFNSGNCTVCGVFRNNICEPF